MPVDSLESTLAAASILLLPGSDGYSRQLYLLIGLQRLQKNTDLIPVSSGYRHAGTNDYLGGEPAPGYCCTAAEVAGSSV